MSLQKKSKKIKETINKRGQKVTSIWCNFDISVNQKSAMRWWFFRGFFHPWKPSPALCVSRWSRCLRWNDHYNYTAKPGDRRPAVVGTAVGFNVAHFVFFPGEEEVRHQQRWKKWRRIFSQLVMIFVCKDFGGLGLPLDFQRPFSISGRMAKMVHPPPKLLKMRSARPIFMTDVACYALQMLFGHTYSMCKC